MTRVLLVDDDAELRNLYEELLIGAGYQVETAVDGESALAKITAGGYDLVVLDIMMPKIDGLEVLRRLKALNPPPKNGPIVMLSALDQMQVINEAISLGAAGFLHKPELTPDQFLMEIKNYIVEHE
ncbi:MAG: response regulator [Candidatus Daviesbacteria bacterium]|nr:response regulator [Candidatus Daviesbacteria bacterium]